MAEATTIEWCHASWSPWYGCIKVSAGCENCYASVLAQRLGTLGKWGPVGTGARRVAAESAWREPLAWDRKAAKAGERRRVFPSMCDPFEDWSGILVDAYDGQLWDNGSGSYMASANVSALGVVLPGPARKRPNESCRPLTMADVRRRFADLIRRTPNLDWLLLTKRPENAARMLAEMFGADRSTWPTNFRVGTSVEDQASADARLPHLIQLGWPNFVSFEPALGPVDFGRVRWQLPDSIGVVYGDTLGDTNGGLFSPRGARGKGIDWVIVGGESGPNARPMHPKWAYSVRDQCAAAGVPYLFKQWGEWAPLSAIGAKYFNAMTPKEVRITGGPLDGLVVPVGYFEDKVDMLRVGKKAAGRLLDGVLHDGFPDFAGVARA